MQFVLPSYTILDLPDATDHDGVLRFLERVGRTCYKSEDKITDDSAVKYLKMIRDRKHWAMLEHYIFVMEVTEKIYNDFTDPNWFSIENTDYIKKIKYINMSSAIIDGRTRYLVSGSITAFNYLHECKCFRDESNQCCGQEKVFLFLKERFPEISSTIDDNDKIAVAVGTNGIKLLTQDEISKLTVKERMLHGQMTVRYVVDRGVTHELVRHRPGSWAQESTRYCNYSKKGMTYILPLWIDDKDKETILSENTIDDMYNMFKHDMKCRTMKESLNNLLLGMTNNEFAIETIYYLIPLFMDTYAYEKLNKGVNHPWVPQQSRAILPNSIKAEIVQTFTLDGWVHFFDMRADSAAHPQMREVVQPLLEEANEKYDGIFQDQVNNNIFKLDKE